MNISQTSLLSKTAQPATQSRPSTPPVDTQAIQHQRFQDLKADLTDTSKRKEIIQDLSEQVKNHPADYFDQDMKVDAVVDQFYESLCQQIRSQNEKNFIHLPPKTVDEINKPFESGTTFHTDFICDIAQTLKQDIQKELSDSE